MPTLALFDVLQDPYPALTETQIRAVEREIGVRFPDDYVRFLQKCNGGHCAHTVEYVSPIPLPGWSAGHIEIDEFFAITDDPDDYNDIRAHSPLDKLTSDPVPPHLVPFADVGAEGRFCIAGAGPEFPKVYFWSNDDGSIHFIAPSFTAFLERVKLPEDRTWNLTDAEVDTIPVFLAIRYGDTDAVREYLDGGGDVNLRTERGTTLLMCAAHARWPKIFELLFFAGADWHRRDPDGWDALHYAVAAQSLLATKLLLEAGADPNTRDNKGESPLNMLIGDRLFDLLEAHGAKRASQNERDDEVPK